MSDDVTGEGVQFGKLVGGQSHIECADIAEHVSVLRVPGIGTTSGPRVSTHASATWPGSTPSRDATRATALTNCLFASKAPAT